MLALRYFARGDFGPTHLTTPIGGKPVSIELRRNYVLEWNQQGHFWFLEAQGRIEHEGQTA
jgi:hypothetical protein